MTDEKKKEKKDSVGVWYYIREILIFPFELIILLLGGAVIVGGVLFAIAAVLAGLGIVVLAALALIALILLFLAGVIAFGIVAIIVFGIYVTVNFAFKPVKTTRWVKSGFKKEALKDD